MKLMDTEALTGLPLLDFIAADKSPKPRRTGTLAERHAAKVAKAGPDECWNWQGAADIGSMGYGRIRQTRKTGEKIGKKDYAHRVAFMLANGPIPDNHVVRHTCDNPLCCNPAHLVDGIPADNTADMVARNRQRRNLTRGEVVKIDAMLNDGKAIHAIAEKFKVSERAIRHIERGVTWAKTTGRTCTWPSRQKNQRKPARNNVTATIEAAA